MTLGGKTAIMRFVRGNVMSVCPLPVGRAETYIITPLLHRICKDVFHALAAVKLDDFFHCAVLQVHPVEIFPNEDIDPARAGTILAEAFAPFFDLAALACGFGIVGIN